MKRFKFRMQAVLETREREEDLAREALVEVERALDECRTNLNALVSRQIEHHKEMARIGHDITRTDEINELFHYSQELASQIERQNHLLAEAERRVDGRREELKRIMQDRKMLESLREKDLVRWRRENEREEQEMLDEIGATAHLRNGERGSTMTNALIILVVLIIAGAIIYGVSLVENWMTAKVQEETEETVAITAPLTPVPGEPNGDTEATGTATPAPGERATLNEIATADLSNVESIRDARDQLYERATEMARWEEELTQRQKELDAYAKEVEEDREAVEKRIAYFEELKQEVERRERLSVDKHIEALAKMYNGMDAPKVADLMLDLDDEDVVAILAQMQTFAAQEVIQSLISKNKERALAIQKAFVEEQTGS